MRTKKIQKEHRWAALSILLIPILTLLFGTKKSPFQFTLSMIGNRFDARFEFISWGIICGAILIFYMFHLFRLGAFFDKEARKLVIRSAIFLVLCVAVPAIEEIWPVMHRLHAVFGAFFGFALVIAIFYFIRYLKSFDKKLYSFSLTMLFLVVGGSILLLFIFGNTGIFEIFFFTSVSILLFFIEGKVKKVRKQLFDHIKGVQEFLTAKHKKKLN